MHFVYKLTFIKDDECLYYYGETSDLAHRLATHRSNINTNTHHNPKITQAINDGWVLSDEVVNVVLESSEEAYELEQLLIEEGLLEGNCLNVGIGHDNLTVHPEGNRLKKEAGERLKAWIDNLSPEDRRRFRSRHGERNPMFGKTHSDETRKKLSLSHLALAASRPSPLIGRTFTEAHKTALSKAASLRVGELNPFHGKKHTEETKRAWSEKKKGILPPNTMAISIDGVRYISMTEAARQLNLNVTVVRWRVLSKNPKFSKWVYVD